MVATERRTMKLKPHQHRQAALHLKKLAELAEDPQEKKSLMLGRSGL
jgi:hypothetical protein